MQRSEDREEWPLTMRVQLAVMASDLPQVARHMVHVMAVLAEQDTGEGWHGQETIAEKMGGSGRNVRRLMLLLEKPNSSGVRLERRARFRRDGRGRTSDDWRLVLDVETSNRTTTTTNRTEVPPDRGSAGQRGTTNRTQRYDQPDSLSGDLGSDLGSDLVSIDRANPRSSKKGSRKRSRPETEMPPDWQPTEAHREFAEKHGLDVELEAVGFRGHFEGRRVASWNGRFATWLSNQVKWNRQRNGAKHLPPPQTGMASTYRQGSV